MVVKQDIQNQNIAAGFSKCLHVPIKWNVFGPSVQVNNQLKVGPMQSDKLLASMPTFGCWHLRNSPLKMLSLKAAPNPGKDDGFL